MEVKLCSGKREIEMYDNFSKLFAIVKATEKVVKACVGAHFKTLSPLLKDITPSFEHFIDAYIADALPGCPAPPRCTGVPATAEHRAALATSPAVVAEFVQSFLTSLDSFTLNMVAVDQMKSVIHCYLICLFPTISCQYYHRSF